MSALRPLILRKRHSSGTCQHFAFGPRCGGSKPTRLTSLRGQTHSAVDSTVIGDPRDSARSILARPCPGCGGYLRPTYGQGCHAVRLQSSSEPCEFRPIGSQLRKSCRRSRVGALSAHQRQEALQRLATGETQADIARSYNVDRPRSADCNKFVEERHGAPSTEQSRDTERTLDPEQGGRVAFCSR
jgi:hypothetical protein